MDGGNLGRESPLVELGRFGGAVDRQISNHAALDLWIVCHRNLPFWRQRYAVAGAASAAKIRGRLP